MSRLRSQMELRSKSKALNNSMGTEIARKKLSNANKENNANLLNATNEAQIKKTGINSRVTTPKTAVRERSIASKISNSSKINTESNKKQQKSLGQKTCSVKCTQSRSEPNHLDLVPNIEEIVKQVQKYESSQA